MENRPPYHIARHSSLMHPRHPSKSSPVKRDPTRVLTPQSNHALAPTDAFNTGLLTPQASQNTFDSDAATSLISPPPEDSARAGTNHHSSSWTRADSEPASNLRHVTDTSSLSKRKRPSFPSLSLPDSSGPSRPQLMGEASPNPKPRKQTRRARVGPGVEDDVRSSGHRSANVSPGVRKQRQSLAPPPENISPDHRPHSPLISPSKSRRSPALFRSPHANNDKADFIPPIPSPTRQHLSAQARSSTPIPPYEPPRERFTPPREVFRASPRVSKSSKRKKTLSISIKKEPPEIDLSCLPPPSPTDDPLLLHGRERRPRPSVPTNARETPLLESTPPRPGKQLSPLNPCALDFSLPGIPSDVDDNEDIDSLKQPVFDFAANVEDSWSSSDDGTLEQEGEYTGKFRVMQVPTKADPPTSGTRERIEQWGRPVSPFPRRGSPIPEHEHEEDDDGDDAGDLDLSLVQPQFQAERVEDRHVPESPPKDVREPISEVEVLQEPANAPEISETEHTAPSRDLTHDNHVEVTSGEEAHNGSGAPPYPQEVVGELVEAGDEIFREDGIIAAQESDEAVDEFHPVASRQDDLISAEIFVSHPGSDDGEFVGEDRNDEETVDRALSEELVSPSQHPPEPQLLEECIEVDEPMAEPVGDADAESEEDSSDDSDLSVVKIVSDDPWAAARAAAILKQHDWDLVMKASRKSRSPRTVESLIRKTRLAGVTSASVRKSLSPARTSRRSFGVVVDGRVLMRGSPSMTLPELLNEAESGLNSPASTKSETPGFRTPSPTASSFRRPEAPLVIDTDGPREWSRSDWKLLDACFTDVRLDVGARWGYQGLLGDVDAVELEDVVRRFEDIFGGEEVVAGLGPAFEREDVLKRAKALQKKQRSGQGAPPTPTLRFSSVSSTPTVPDFTPVHPARRQGVISTQPKLAAPSFLAQTTQGLPPSLLAPRYSHLLEEAKSLSKEDNLGSSTPGESPATPAPTASDRPVDDVTPYVKQEESEQEQRIPSTPSVGGRVKGFLFSYLPTLKTKKPVQKTHEPARPALPLPPPELLEKPRGPIITPQPKPLPRVTHPKELVQLQHAPSPTLIPTLSRIPKRLVDLRPVSPPPVASAPIKIPEGRRSSGGSVKDLVSSFEEIDRSREIEAHALELRRKKNAAMAAKNTTSSSSRPAWR